MHSDEKTLAEVFALKPPSKPVEYTRTDTPEYLREARRKDGVRYFAKFCPKAFQYFDLAYPIPNFAENMESVKTVLDWQYQAKGMLITGPTGRAKTRASWQLLNRLYATEGTECRWYHAMDFFTELHDCMKYGRDDAKGWIDAVAWRACVFIDDWGQEANTKAREDWAQSWWFRFLDLRLERHLPTIITTNLTAKDIAQKNNDVRSDPLLRRLLETSTVIKFQ